MRAVFIMPSKRSEERESLRWPGIDGVSAMVSFPLTTKGLWDRIHIVRWWQCLLFTLVPGYSAYELYGCLLRATGTLLLPQTRGLEQPLAVSTTKGIGTSTWNLIT